MSASLAFWVDRLDPFLIRFSGNFGIRYYGLSYAVGFVAAAWLLSLYAKAGRSGLPASKIGDLMVAVVLGVVLGGRIGSYFLYDYWRGFTSDPFGILRVWEGGMSFHGGLIGVALAVAWFSRAERIPMRGIWDVLSTTAPAGLFFGRIANFVNGELWGRPTVVPWAVIFPRSGPPEHAGPLVPRHPSQLYEAGMEGLLLFAYMQWRFWKSDVARDRPGRLCGEFLIGYALARIAGETFREPDASLFFGLSRGTFYSLFMIALGLYMILSAPRPKPRAAA
jgi:phosphatidylglycerol:prolipoprotein diacylglycerol transferase